MPQGALTGATIARRFDVLDLLGEGGMGEVYRARDRELDELVALKVIRRELAGHPEFVDQFRREVKLARRVTHRNVARIYELGFDDNLVFCTMELIEGHALSSRIAGGPKLPLRDSVAIAVALCDALEAAHSAGVIHRDLKPGNVLITASGRAVLTDFGLAAVRHAAGDLSGTPRYVAPEQALGEPPTPAADVYALGVLLSELVTGQPAFRGSVSDILDAKQSTERIEPAPELGVDPELGRLIGRATARLPTQRIASARALRESLLRWLGGPAEVTIPVAELPPAELPTVIVHPPAIARARAPYLAEAFHHELVHALAARPGLRVLTRPAGHTDGSALRVDVDVVDDDATVETYGPSLSNPVSVRAHLAVDDLRSQATAAAQAIAALIPRLGSGRPSADPAAVTLLLRARHLTKIDRLSLQQAVELYERALELAPADPSAMAGLAMTHVKMAFFSAAPHPELLAHASRAATQALAAAPDHADTQLAAGHVELHGGDAVRAAAHFRKAIACAPHQAEAHAWLGSLLLEAGYVTDGEARCRDALAMAPDYEVPRWDLSRAYALAGRWDESDQMSREVMSMLTAPRRWTVRARMAAWRNDLAGVAAVRNEIAPGADHTYGFEHDLAVHMCDVFTSSSWAGARDEIIARVTNPSLVGARRRVYVAQLAAEAAGWVGDVDVGLDMLARADAHGLIDRLWLERCPSLAPLRSAPRFGAILSAVRERADAVHDALFGEAPPPRSAGLGTDAAALAETQLEPPTVPSR